MSTNNPTHHNTYLNGDKRPAPSFAFEGCITPEWWYNTTPESQVDLFNINFRQPIWKALPDKLSSFMVVNLEEVCEGGEGTFILKFKVIKRGRAGEFFLELAATSDGGLELDRSQILSLLNEKVVQQAQVPQA